MFVNQMSHKLDELRHCAVRDTRQVECLLCRDQLRESVEEYRQHAKTQAHLKAHFNAINHTNLESKPIVFVSKFESDAILLPLRNVGCRIESVNYTKKFDFDYELLEQSFKENYNQTCLKLAIFAAGSSITGAIFDVDRIQ